MNLDQDFFQVSKLSEDQKKRSSPEMEHFFSPNSSTDLRSDAHQSQITGGDAEEDHTQIAEGIQSNYWGNIGFRHPHPPRVSPPLLEQTYLDQHLNRKVVLSKFDTNIFSAVARATKVRGHKPKVGGTKINWIFAHKNWYFTATN